MRFFSQWQARSDDPDTRKRAAAKLGVPGDAKAVAALVPLLGDPDPSVRAAAAEALGRTGEASAVGPLLDAARGLDGVPETARAPLHAALAAALRATGRGAVPALIGALSGKDQRVREVVVEALGGIGTPDAIPALVAALGDERSSVRQAATRGLGRAATAESAAALVAAATHRDAATRRAVVEVLPQIAGAPGAIAALTAALTDADRTVREEAVRALGRVGSDEAVVSLLAAYFGDDRDLRAAATDVLKSLAWKPQDARQRATAAVIRGDYAAAAALGRVAVEPLLVALADRDPAARRSAAEAIALTRDARAAQALTGALADRDESVRLAAARTLAQIGPAAAPPVVDRLDDESPEVAASARAVLRDMGESAVVTYLMNTMPGVDFAKDDRIRLVTVGTTGDIDRARLVIGIIECAVRHVAPSLDPKTLTAVASMYDIARLGSTGARGRDVTAAVEERVSLAALRKTAASELRRRGLTPPPG